jgi:hypothetical protein
MRSTDGALTRTHVPAVKRSAATLRVGDRGAEHGGNSGTNEYEVTHDPGGEVT